MSLSAKNTSSPPAGGEEARGLGRPAWIALVATLIPATALAHPGDHHALGLAAAARHVLTEPDHLMTLAALGLVAASLLVGSRRARR